MCDIRYPMFVFFPRFQYDKGASALPQQTQTSVVLLGLECSHEKASCAAAVIKTQLVQAARPLLASQTGSQLCAFALAFINIIS